MQTPQSSPPPAMKIQGCEFSCSDAVASYQQLDEKRILNRDMRASRFSFIRLVARIRIALDKLVV
jgi:hypothetical protein